MDANLEVLDALLSPAGLEADALALAEKDVPTAWFTSARRVARRIQAAKETLRGPASATVYRAALETLSEGLRLVSRARGCRVTLSDLDCAGLSPLSTSDLLRLAREPSRLSIAPQLVSVVGRLLADSPPWIGVSCTYLSQALPAFALAGLLREAGYDGTLILGGALISSLAPRLRRSSQIFRIWDAVVVGPGEAALEGLARGRPEAPGLLCPGRGIWNPPLRKPVVCYAPDPEGLPWPRYLAPGPILPLAASRGCYWRRCAFCPESAQDGQAFQAARPASLADTLLRARDRYGFSRVHLTDDAVPPATLRGLARSLRDEGLIWYGFARLERELLDPAFAEALAAGGCAMLQLGVETASQRLLDLLGKGTRAADAEAILGNLTAAGIRTYVYLLFGSPTETEEEALETIEWAASHRDRISFLNLALMNLPRGSTLERAPARYGLASLEEWADEADLSLYRGYTSTNGRDRRHGRQILDRARSHPALRPILARTPLGFSSNHAAFVPLSPSDTVGP